jgi:catechol 2,3-dioxygenase-like lactoylglutathione lyase family enzyme
MSTPSEPARTPRVTAIHHIAIQTSDLDRALAFYVDLLGAELLVRRPFKAREMAWLRIGSLQIELFSVRRGQQLLSWNDDYSGPVHLALVVDDVDAFLAAATALGATLHPSHPEPFVPPVPGAGKIAYLLGPDGEEVEIRTAT